VDKNRSIYRQRRRRRWRVRANTHGNTERPRLTVFRSHKHICCQIIDDEAGKTLISAGTRDASLRDTIKYGGNKNAAESIGRVIAERALAAGIKAVRFDRGHYKYHGRVAALADSARQAGLDF
jgi:large subunit ribosomal protein L18